MRRTNAGLLLAGAAAVFIALALVRPAAAVEPLTACPSKAGYSAVPDFALTTTTEPPTYATLSEAEEACNADPDCKHFNNYGEVYTTLVNVVSKRADGVCTYLKTECPAVEGYQNLPKGVSWDTSDTFVSSQVDSPQAFCESRSDCVAWNSEGWVALAASFGELVFTVSDTSTVCTYVPDPCPFKAGFASYPARSIVPGVGLDGVNSGSMGDLVKSEAYCRITPKCSAYSSNGGYAVGGFGRLEASDVKCTFVKDPCPPINGYTAYDGVANDHSPSASFPFSAYYPSLCFAEFARNCSANYECVIFDTLRYQWRTDVVHFNDYPGMCTYRKAAGFFDGDAFGRRRALSSGGSSSSGASKLKGSAAAVAATEAYRAYRASVKTRSAEAEEEAVPLVLPPNGWVVYFVHFTNPATHDLNRPEL